MKSSKTDLYIQKYNKGVSSYEKGNYNKAIDYFVHAQLSNNDILNVEATYYLGQSYYALSKYPKAVSCFHSIINSSEAALKLGGKKISDIKICSYHYKGNALYALKKYQGAIESFDHVPDKHKLALVANLYKGFCYEHLTSTQYQKAEGCYKIVLSLYPKSQYEDKDTIKDMAQGALITNLIHQNKIDQLIKTYTEEFNKKIDAPDTSGNTLLMYATTHENKGLIKKLIEKGCNPFKADKFGNSAFSIALKNGNEQLAKTFFTKFYPSELDDFSEQGEFAHFIGINICKQDSELKEFFSDTLKLAQKSQMACFNAAESYCESLGQDTHELLLANDLI